MRRALWFTTAGVVIALGRAHAQTVNVWPGVAPGSERWTQKELTIANTPLGTLIGELRQSLETMQHRVSELEERVDFAERLLAKHRDADRLGQG